LIRILLKDLNNEEIEGSFYEPESLKAKQNIFGIIFRHQGEITRKDKLWQSEWDMMMIIIIVR